MKSYQQLSSRYMKHRKKRAALSVSCMVLTTMFIYIAATLGINTYSKNLAALQAKKNYHICIYNTTGEQEENFKNHVLVGSETRAAIKTNVYLKDGRRPVAEWIALENPEQDVFGWKLVSGRLPETEDEVAISNITAKSFKYEQKVGDTITDLRYDEETDGEIEGKTYRICGILTREQEKSEDSMSGYMDYFEDESLSFVVGLAGKDMPLNSYIRFRTPYAWTSPLNPHQWQEKAKTLHTQAGISYCDQGGPAPSYEIHGDMAVYYMQSDSFMIIGSILLLAILLIVYFCSVMVRSLFSANLIDKLTDFSILKSMGASNSQLKKIFMRECMAEGVIAYVIAVALGNAMIYGLLYGVLRLYTLPLDFSVPALLAAAVFAYCTLLLAVLEPFGLLKRLSVVEGIGQQYAVSAKGLKKRGGGLFRILGIEGVYAYKNIRRNSKSFWNSVAAFTASILLFTALATGLSNVMPALGLEDKEAYGSQPELLYDIQILSPESNMMKRSEQKDMLEQLRREPYVEAVHIYSNEMAVIKDASEEELHISAAAKQKLEANDIQISPRVFSVEFLTKDTLLDMEDDIEGGRETIEAIQNGGLLLVNKKNIGSETLTMFDCKVGDTMPWNDLDSYAAFQAQDSGEAAFFSSDAYKLEDYEIKGFASRSCVEDEFMSTWYARAIMSYEYLEKRCGKEKADCFCSSLLVRINESNYNRDALNKIVVQDGDMTWAYMDMQRMVNEKSRTVKAMIIFFVVFVLMQGVVSVVNTMINEQMTRKREIALMRAVGMSKNGLNKMLTLEKVIIGLLAWVIGTVLGVVFVYFLVAPLLVEREAAFHLAWSAYLASGGLMLGFMVIMSRIMIHSLGVNRIAEDIRRRD